MVERVIAFALTFIIALVAGYVLGRVDEDEQWRNKEE